ncbi:hypothetical protein [Amycolatopsis palatopharyngis]|uniref:hypothetical protein n=1 Tax=Amycolatopsis palatopharyngis TaxID=187982 RepID=UPI001FE97313|nr:hypothetical protein [Amycolatopsis palatopharyngis]
MSIIETITAAFTAPGAHVVLVDIGTPSAAVTTPCGTDNVPASGEASVTAAREAVHALGRTADTLTLDPSTDVSVVSSRPFWADLVTDTADPLTALAGSSPAPVHTSGTDDPGAPESERGERADLVLVSLPAHAAETVPLDRLALLAAHRLRSGGIFAVYTHSDWNQGRFVDPTGAIVAACQHADLLYLQHIVALHTPIREGRLRPAPSAAAAADYERTRHRATVRGLPVPHLRAHGDILAFAHPASPAGSCEVRGFQDEPTGGLTGSLGADRSVRAELVEASS